MLMLISPAKTLDFSPPPASIAFTQPRFQRDAQSLIDTLRQLSPEEIGKLMSISPKLAEQNVQRYHDWQLPFSIDNAKQAILAFRGDVYTGLDADSLTDCARNFAQRHVRILSGLYGLLQPLDLIQPYRLEMGTRLTTDKGSNLYQYWGNGLTESLNQELTTAGTDVVVNLASNEYFKAIKTQNLNATVITPAFLDRKNGVYKMISFYAKKARGSMVRFIADHQLSQPDTVRQFDRDGYRYCPQRSEPTEPVFIRDQEQ